MQTIIEQGRDYAHCDGKTSVYTVAEVIRIRTGETGDAAV